VFVAGRLSRQDAVGAAGKQARWRNGTAGKYGAAAAGRRRRAARGVAHAKRRAGRLRVGRSGQAPGNALAQRGWPETRTCAVAQSGEIRTANAGAEQGKRGNWERSADAWGQWRERERRPTVGRGCFAVFGYKSDGWINGPDPVRNENWISVFF
jgi:hypothetical protein